MRAQGGGLTRAFGFVLGARSYFFVERDSFFVALRPLASIGRLKDRDLCVWKSGKDAQKLTINNKFHVKHSDGWRSFT